MGIAISVAAPPFSGDGEVQRFDPAAPPGDTTRRTRRGRSTLQGCNWRAADVIASVEHAPEEWVGAFRDALNFVTLGGRANALSDSTSTRYAQVDCFIQPLSDSVYESIDGKPSIIAATRQAIEIMRLGGSVGYDFSVIRPKGSLVSSTESRASGPVKHMQAFDTLCNTIIPTAAPRGVQTGVLRCDHPDIFEFVSCKQVPGYSASRDTKPLRNFDLHVGVTDKLMEAVLADGEFQLTHDAAPSAIQVAQGAFQRDDGKWVYRTVRARDLWGAILQSVYARSQHGVLFLDRIQEDNNLRYCESITATNRCQEPLPPFGCCDTAHLSLHRFVTRTVWEGVPSFDFERLAAVTHVLVRMLDNVLDLAPWPLPEQETEAKTKRRIGIGVDRLGEMLIMMGLKYSSAEGRAFAVKVMETIRDAAYAGSSELAMERGAFPLFDPTLYLQGVRRDMEGTFASQLCEGIKQQIRTHGIRNSHLLTMAPVTEGLQPSAGTCSSGFQPVGRFTGTRDEPCSVREGGSLNAALARFRASGGDIGHLPEYFECSADVPVAAQIEMLKALASPVDSAATAAFAVPQNYPYEQFAGLVTDAWVDGLKGVTIIKPIDHRGPMLVVDNGKEATASPAPQAPR